MCTITSCLNHPRYHVRSWIFDLAEHCWEPPMTLPLTNLSHCIHSKGSWTGKHCVKTRKPGLAMLLLGNAYQYSIQMIMLYCYALVSTIHTRKVRCIEESTQQALVSHAETNDCTATTRYRPYMCPSMASADALLRICTPSSVPRVHHIYLGEFE